MSATPIIHRPVPRRPFAVKPTSPPADNNGQLRKESSGTAKLFSARPSFLDTDLSPTPAGDAAGESISRAQSIKNLTSSTLVGIFSPSVSSRPSAIFEPGTPYGTDSSVQDVMVQGTTASAAEIDEVRKASQSLMMLQRQHRKGETIGPADDGASHIPPASSRAALLFSLAVRAALLFSLGMGYGVLMARLRRETHASLTLDDFAMPPPPVSAAPTPPPQIEYDAIYDWRYLVSWGLSGIVLGTLLPWFDGVWDRTFAGNDNILGLKARTAPEVHWDHVVRGIGAFAGIVFAMRKLPWASTMQASVTLALVNPFLWYLLDRSKSGLLLAAAIGFSGSSVLMALGLDLMPNPGVQTASYRVGYGMGLPSHHRNGSSRDPAGTDATHGFDPASSGVSAETAVWMLSVLFCSCICFGNIGRRLALSTAPAVRPR